MLHFLKLLLCDFSNSKTANRLKHISKRKILARIRIRLVISRKMTRHHRTARNKNSRQVKACGSHQHSRNNLVAVRNHNKSVKLMSFCNTFNTVGNKLACYKRIFHSLVSHRNSITDANRRKFNRSSASHSNASLNSLRNPVKFNMPRNKFIFCTNNTNQRLIQFLISITRSIKKRTVRRAGNTLTSIITFF